MPFRSPRRRSYSAYICSVIASMLSISLMAVCCSGMSSPASVAFCATVWISEPKFVATLPMRGPEKRFSSIQHTGHAHRLSTADGDRVTTSDCRVLPSWIVSRSASETGSSTNGQQSGSAALMPREASNANVSAASRAFGLFDGSIASTLRAAAIKPRGSDSSPA